MCNHSRFKSDLPRTSSSASPSETALGKRTMGQELPPLNTDAFGLFTKSHKQLLPCSLSKAVHAGDPCVRRNLQPPVCFLSTNPTTRGFTRTCRASQKRHAYADNGDRSFSLVELVQTPPPKKKTPRYQTPNIRR